jgi:sugar lactone lactonase YvrE
MKNKSVLLPAILVGVASVLTSGIAAADNVFVSASGSDTIYEIPSGGSPEVFAGTDVNGATSTGPTGMAFNTVGDLFVATNSGSIDEFSSTGAFLQTFATGLSNARGLAFDSAGNLYVAEQSSGTIEKFSSTGVGTTFATGLDAPNGITFDSAGNLYVANGGSNTIDEITSGGTVSTFASAGLSSPNGVAFDSAGNLFVVNHNSSSIGEYSSTGIPLLSPYSTNFTLDGPKGLAFDSEGDLFVTDYADNSVTEYNTNGVETTFATGISGACFVTVQPDAVPEPSTYAMLAAGLGALVYLARRKALQA